MRVENVATLGSRFQEGAGSSQMRSSLNVPPLTD